MSKNTPPPDDLKTSLEADQNDPILKMAERPDWALFRSVEGLQQKAGVPEGLLRRLVLKEIGDNGADAGSSLTIGEIGRDAYFVEDRGPGLDGTAAEIASLFSVARPMRSSKLFRLPQRGALGNGLRVVAGAVLASKGSLVVITRNQRIVLRPEADGTTTVVEVKPADQPVGTRVEIGFGSALPRDPDPFAWVTIAAGIADEGESYKGKSSPFWYDPVTFHELILAHGDQPLRALVAQFDGCTGGKAGEIVAAAGLDRATCASVSREQATALLKVARERTRPVAAERLGAVGRDAFPEHTYAVERGAIAFGSAEPQANIPIVAEVWARKTSDNRNAISVTMLVNRTPVTSPLHAYRSDKAISLEGCGLSHYYPDTPTKGAYDVAINITTPFCPITSDGKAPNLEPFEPVIAEALCKATRKAQRAAPAEKKVSQKDCVLENLDEAIAKAGGDGRYRFNERQVLYVLRPIVMEQTGQTLTASYFAAIITDYEAENGDISDMYREPRGSIYHPHRKETITLGTLMVENYKRPPWTFNKLGYLEKEGFNEAAKDDEWPERNDCMLISSKGFSTRAARDLVDKLAATDEPVMIFCVHDSDGYGTMIYQTFAKATKARRARKIKVVNFGLDPWEAIAMGLEVETFDKPEKRIPVADYVRERPYYGPRDNGEYWEEWLQTHRVELNAMTMPQFFRWLDDKMDEHGTGKLIPPPTVIEAELESLLTEAVSEAVVKQILREAKSDRQIAKALAAIKRPSGPELINGINKLYARSPKSEWRNHIVTAVKALVKKVG